MSNFNVESTISRRLVYNADLVMAERDGGGHLHPHAFKDCIAGTDLNVHLLDQTSNVVL